jgi:spermidine/putrescine transport system permease protein
MSADPRPVPADGQAMAADPRPGVAAQERRSRRALRRLDHWVLPAFTILAIVYLLMPIAVMIIYSFNDPIGKFNYAWNEFSLAAWQNPLGRPGLPVAVANSLIVAVLATLVATTLGTLIALALTRYSFRGRSATNLFIFVPMAAPEIVLGASLLTLFVGSASLEPFKSIIPAGLLFPLGLNTILIAHIMFCISFVVVTVRARIQGFDNNLEQAAGDLYANEWQTFWRVTFPLIFPGILAGALLAFSLSIDDFIVTNFASGTTNTFPIWVWSTIRNSLPPQVNVIGTIIFSLAVGLVVVATLIGRYRAQRAMRPS